MRILLIHNSADIYGASRSLLRLVARLDRSRFDPVILLPEEGPLRAMLEEAGGKVVIQPSLRIMTRSLITSPKLVGFLAGFFSSVKKTATFIRRENISLVHTNTGVIVSPALAAKWAGVPHIWHIRDWFQEFGKLWPPYARYIMATSASVICVSRAIANQFPTSEKITIINNGFDLAEFPPLTNEEKGTARAQFGFSPSDIVVGNVGRIKFVRKGQEFLLQAIAALKAHGLPIKGLLAGGTAPGAEDHFQRMQLLARNLGLAADVVFTHELPDARPAYAAMDIFVLPSAQPEPFGGVVMEAMSLGLPVVGTSIGGTLEQVVDQETGFLVPPADSSSLASAIIRLAEDPHLRSQMGAKARQRITSHFPLEKMTSEIEGIYSTLTTR